MTEDIRLEIPEFCRDRASSWVNAGWENVCAVNERTLLPDEYTPLVPTEPFPFDSYSSRNGYESQRRALPPEEDDSFDYLTACPGAAAEP